MTSPPCDKRHRGHGAMRIERLRGADTACAPDPSIGIRSAQAITPWRGAHGPREQSDRTFIGPVASPGTRLRMRPSIATGATARMSMLPRMRRASRAVRVGQASCGRGVFAKRRFRTDEVIGNIEGAVFGEPTYSSDYCMELSASLVLEPDAPFRYLNHSCAPNCELIRSVRWDEQDSARQYLLALKSLRLIHSGEELTIDYAWPASCAIPCCCGSRHCRGWIVAQSALGELPPLSQSS